ncbi:MAG: hypothetical protein ABIK61_07500 [candidate division WOR-3 bacterium]
MKKIKIIILLLLVFIINIWAQYNFNLQCLSDTFQTVSVNGIAEFRFRLTNTGSFTDVYELKCHIIESVPGWFVSLCVKGRCVIPGISIFDTLNVGQSDTTICITVYTTSVTGREIIGLNVRSLGDQNKRDSIRVYTQIGQGIEQNTNLSEEFLPGIKIYPNPSKPSAIIYLPNLKTNQSKSTIIMIHDITGKLVKTYIYDHSILSNTKIFWDGKNEQGKSVSAGKYIVGIVQDARQIASKTINLVK